MNIKTITAREVLDSRGNPTVEATVVLDNGLMSSAKVPSGASTGSHEAWELRDGGKRYGGKGVLKAVENVNKKIAPLLKNKDIFQLIELDRLMIESDGTKNKSKLGANAILAVSLALARVGALAKNISLYRYIREVYTLDQESWLKKNEWKMPIATMNIMNGGAHAGWILDFQEYMIVPQAKKFSERVRMGSEVFHALGRLLQKKGFSTAKGDEGGYSISLKSNEEAFKLVMQAIKDAGYRAGKDILLAMDPAVSELYDTKKQRYVLKVDKKILTSEQLMSMWEKWLKKYPIISLEDGLAEDDWEAWEKLTKKYGKKITIVGDDLFVTNVERVQEGISRGVANAVLIKLNQIGTLSETIETIKLAKRNQYKISVSHRSGETADTFIADLAVAVNAEFIKTGSLSRSERVEKYNRLMEIEQEVGL
jgi:enolase